MQFHTVYTIYVIYIHFFIQYILIITLCSHTVHVFTDLGFSSACNKWTYDSVQILFVPNHTQSICSIMQLYYTVIHIMATDNTKKPNYMQITKKKSLNYLHKLSKNILLC